MSIGETSGPIHPVPTRRSGYLYLFYNKHHGRGGHEAAQWLPSLSRDDEFAVFDVADRDDLSDERGWLYGIRPRDEAAHIPDLGTWGQQIAEFPLARSNDPGTDIRSGPWARKGPRIERVRKADRPRVSFSEWKRWD